MYLQNHSNIIFSYGRFSLMNRSSIGSIQDVPNLGSVRCSTVYPERKSRMSSIWQTRTSGDLCRLGDEDEDASVRLDSVSADHLARVTWTEIFLKIFIIIVSGKLTYLLVLNTELQSHVRAS